MGVTHDCYRVIFSIKWDTDGQDVPELPTEIVVDAYSLEDAKAISNADVADCFSDEYGFCIDSITSRIEGV